MSLIEEYPRKAAYGISATAFSNSEELAERIGEFVFSSRLPNAGYRRVRACKAYQRRIYDNEDYYIHLAIRRHRLRRFEVHAHRYLTKPVEKEKLYRALNELDKDAYSFRRLLVRNGGDSKLIDIDSIYFIKVERKDAYIHYDSGGEEKVFVCKRSLDSLEKELTPFHFSARTAAI